MFHVISYISKCHSNEMEMSRNVQTNEIKKNEFQTKIDLKRKQNNEM